MIPARVAAARNINNAAYHNYLMKFSTLKTFLKKALTLF